MSIKKIIALVAVLVCISAWTAFGVGMFLDVSTTMKTVLLTVAAFATEGLIWAMAFVLGLTVFEARQKIWRFLTGRGRRDEAARDDRVGEA